MVNLRPLVESDLPFLLEVRNDFSTRTNLEYTKIISLEDSKKWFKTTKPRWFIIEYKGKPVGYIRTSNDTGETIWIGADIHPSFRREGHARKAYRVLINDLFDKGYTRLYLEVYVENAPAINLYYSLGFIKVSTKTLKDKRKVMKMVLINEFPH